MNLNDQELINSIQKDENVNSCLLELINRHSGIFYDIVNKFVPPNSPVVIEKIYSAKEICIFI
jgi:hypothetical protein